MTALFRPTADWALIDDVAPYPRSQDKVTADGLALWLTARAYQRYHTDVAPARAAWDAAGQPPHGPTRDAYERASSAFVAECALVFALGELSMSAAHRIALGVWRIFDAEPEEALPDLLMWLEEDGITPAQLLPHLSESEPSQ